MCVCICVDWELRPGSHHKTNSVRLARVRERKGRGNSKTITKINPTFETTFPESQLTPQGSSQSLAYMTFTPPTCSLPSDFPLVGGLKVKGANLPQPEIAAIWHSR